MKAMSRQTAKIALSAHISASVGWLGAVGTFLALALTGLLSQDEQLIRACYLTMKMVGWWVVVPLALASFASGLIQSLGTSWGLFQHYWIIAKFSLTIIASALLLLHMQVASRMAGFALAGPLATGDHRALRLQLVADALGAALVLLVATGISVFKPQGRTRWSQADSAPRDQSADGTVPRWLVVLSIGTVAALLAGVIYQHLSGGGFHHQ